MLTMLDLPEEMLSSDAEPQLLTMEPVTDLSRSPVLESGVGSRPWKSSLREEGWSSCCLCFCPLWCWLYRLSASSASVSSSSSASSCSSVSTQRGMELYVCDGETGQGWMVLCWLEKNKQKKKSVQACHNNTFHCSFMVQIKNVACFNVTLYYCINIFLPMFAVLGQHSKQ